MLGQTADDGSYLRTGGAVPSAVTRAVVVPAVPDAPGALDVPADQPKLARIRFLSPLVPAYPNPMHTPTRMSIVLRMPTEDEEAEVLRAHRATSPAYASFLAYYEEGMSFRRYLDVLRAQQRGDQLPPGHVPSTFLFAFAEPRIVGRVSIRHALNPFLERIGGHIGYAVVPEFRRKGYATEILRQALVIARERLGLDRVLVTCDDDNIASIRTIEKNGGVMDNVVTGPDLPVPKRRYWIETARG